MANPARATLADMANMAPAWGRIQTYTTQNQALLNAGSDWLDSKLTRQYDLPLIAPYPQDIVYFEVIWAAYHSLLKVGFNPLASPADAAIAAEYAVQMDWALNIAKGEVGPVVTDSSTEDGVTGPEVITATTRGYSERGVGPGSFPCPRTGPFSSD